MNHEIKRATGLLVLEAVNSNPNGDPTAMASPDSVTTAAGRSLRSPSSGSCVI